ncbi:phage tail protein [Vibrio mediterranei]|uniref:phage tail tip protein J-related protein n=1 Tax=Vibrio mediterranei TaxID=689 RepID=UPI001EFEEA1A|nr:phage tail protein [Vibrio mediterranei]MCG9624647.1 phage tail protein [Vibrio mediterranei]
MATGLAVAGWLLTVGSAGYAVYVGVEAKRQADKAAEAAKGKRTAQKQMYKSATAPKQIVLGHPVTSGPMVFGAESGTPNDEGVGEWLHLVVHIAGHPCHDVTNVWFDDIELARQSAGGNYDAEFRHPNGEGFVYLYLGNHTTAPSTLLSLPDWDDTMIGRGECFAHVKIRSNPEKWPGGVINPKFAVKGLEVFDPRTQRTDWTDNPALLYRWYRNVLKHGVADEDSYITSANLCNEAVDTPEGNEKRYRCNYAFLANESPRTVMATLRSACSGQGLRVAGRHALQVGAYYGPGTVVLDDDDIIGDITTQADVRRRDRINTVTAKYTDPQSNWNELDMPRIQSAEFIAEDNGFEVIDDLDLSAVPSPYQAQRLAWIHLNTKRSAYSIEFTCNLKAAQLLPGTVFRLNFSDNKWSNVEFIVTKWVSSNQNGVKLQAAQHYATQFAHDGTQAIAPQRPGLPSLIDRTHVEPVSHLTYTTLSDDNVLQAVIHWQHQSFGRSTYELSFYKNGSFLRKEDTTDKQYRMTDGFVVGNYEVRVVARNAAGVASPVASIAFSVMAPETPADINVNSGNWALELAPISAGSINFDTMYDFAFGFDAGADDATIEQHIIGRAKVLTISNLKANTEYHIAAREVSRWGQSGWFTKSARTAFNSDDVLEVIDGNITEDMLDDSLKGTLNQKEKRAIDIGNLLADTSRLSADLRAAYQAFKDQETASKTEVGFTYAERTLKKHADEFGVVAEELAQLAAIDKDNLAHSLEYTRTAVGYCVDAQGNITDHNNAVMCVQAGNSWIDGPLAEFIRNLQIQTASGDKASIGSMMQVFEKEDDGGLVARGSMTSDVNGKISGFISNNDGQKSQLDFIADHTRIGVIDDQGNFQSLFWLNAITKTLSIKAQLILTDGHTVTDIDDIRAQDGNDGDTIYTEFQFSSDQNDWHFPDQTGDRYMRSRRVTNGFAGAWGSVTDLKGEAGQNATERYTWIKYADNASGAGMSDSADGKKYIGIAYNKTSATESTNASLYKWSLIQGTDGDTIYTEFQFSSDQSNWHFPSQMGDRYVRSRQVTNNNHGPWGAVSDMRGQDGNNGTPGSGIYTLTLRNGVFPSSATATGDFTQHIGRAPVRDDILTYRNSGGTVSSTKSFDGADWIAPQLLLSGNLITPNSIYGDRFVANTEITSPLIKGGQGYFGAGGPYDNYHTRIDANGTIRTNRLYMKSAETGGRTEQEPTRTSVYDDANTLRVRFGRLT